MGVDSNAEGVDSNAKGVDSNTNSQHLLALIPFDYCVGRCDMYKFMRDPATTDERLSREREIIPNNEFPADINKIKCTVNFEDPNGYYALLGCSKTLSDADIASDHQQEKSIYCWTSLEKHPAKTTNTK